MDDKKRTLIELVKKNLIEVNGKKRTKKKNSSKTKTKKEHLSKSEFPIPSLLMNLKINEAILEAKDEESIEEAIEETADKEPEDKKEIIVNGGYGTVNKHYGISPVVKYTDYSKIWRHLGTFRSHSMYESAENSSEIAMKNGESSREMISERTMDMGARNFKFFGNMNINNTAQDYYTITSLVPPVGANIDSKDWEKYALMMKMSIYQPLIALKFKFA